MLKQNITLPINWLVFAISLSVLPACVSPRFQGLEPPPWNLTSSVQSSQSTSFSSNTAQKPSTKGQYQVKSGDSLSKIALKYDLNFRKLAAANAIKSPWVIYPGQILALKEAKLPINSNSSSSSISHNQSSVSQSSQNTVKPVTSPAPSAALKVKWQWPINGTIVRAFGVGGVSNKGVDIQSSKAQSVMAAANGTVIFTGKGFGEGDLVIIQHANSLLTAYDNTRGIVVKEKQIIKVGQKIAELNKTDKVWQLHFEIRNDGKPIDPQKYLPALLK
jgi:lipoprotein NlpD